MHLLKIIVTIETKNTLFECILELEIPIHIYQECCSLFADFTIIKGVRACCYPFGAEILLSENPYYPYVMLTLTTRVNKCGRNIVCWSCFCFVLLSPQIKGITHVIRPLAVMCHVTEMGDSNLKFCLFGLCEKPRLSPGEWHMGVLLYSVIVHCCLVHS